MAFRNYTFEIYSNSQVSFPNQKLTLVNVNVLLTTFISVLSTESVEISDIFLVLFDYNMERDKTLRFHRLDFLGRGLREKLRPNISLDAKSMSTKPISFPTTEALSRTWSMSLLSDQTRCASWSRLCFVFSPIPHRKNRFSLSSFVSFFCISWLSLYLSLFNALKLFCFTAPNS